jgi:tetratricopeptide (TPR) repeat protein
MIAALLFLLLAVEPAGDLAAAQKALAENRADDAIRLLGSLDDVAAQIVRGRAYLKLADYEAAVEPLLNALEKSPEDKALLRDAAWACWGAARSAGTFASAYLEDGLRYARRSGDALLIANLLYELSRWEEALGSYRTSKDSLHVRVRTAHCLAALKRADESKAAYVFALDEAIRANDLRSAYDLAWRAKQSGRFLGWMDKRVTAAPKNLELRMYRGYMREALRMWKEAAEDLSVVVGLRPDHVAAKRRLARTLFLVGSADQDVEAIAQSEKMARALLKADARDEMSWQTLYWVSGWAWANGDVPRTYSALKLLHSINSSDVSVALSLCGMARRLGKYDEAEGVFRSMLEEDDEDPDLLNDYAILKDARGQIKEARKLWRRVLEVDPGNLNALENLFTKTWESGERETANGYLEKGLAAAQKSGKPALIRRWAWFSNRMKWAPSGFGGES